MALFAKVCLRSCVLKQCTRLATTQLQNTRSYASMSFTFASPVDVYYNNASNVTQVDVPSFSGSFGILPEHVPTMAVLKPGVIVVHEDDGALKKFFVSSGSVTINDDSSVQVLAEEAHPVDRLDLQMIRDGLTKLQHELSSASSNKDKPAKKCIVMIRDGLTKSQQELSSASSEKDKAEAQIAVECYESLQKATE